MNKFLKPIISIILLVCLLDMPYGFYQLVRFCGMCAFAWMAYEYYTKEKGGLAFVFGALALLFQPFLKIALGRGGWNAVDVVVAISLVVLWWKERKE